MPDKQTARPMPARALVVDDDPRGRKLLEGYLRGHGLEVRSAEDGPSALRMAQEETPDIVLLDVMMPRMTGYEVCAQLKANPATRLTQVMLVTALDGTPDKVEGLDTGADDYVTKPVRREEFLAKVRALLRVGRLLRELEDARGVLALRNEELQLKKMLAQSLVHDLKNPLSAILGNLDLLEMRADARHAELIQRSKQGARRMLKMILNLLDVEGLEEGKLNAVLEDVDTLQLAEVTLREAEAAALQKGVTLELDSSGEVRATADGVLLRRVLDNLLSNAVAHSPADGTVRLTLREREEGVEICVEDDGPGVPEEQREMIFEKYVRLAREGGKRRVNRGLGLTFCRLAIESQGGTIWVESSPSGGARFVALLPSCVPFGVAEPVAAG